jgi:hypothetical protein
LRFLARLRGEAAASNRGKTRGLLFLSNAFILASSLGHDKLFFAENGPLMINPHVSIKAEPTKNAHPYLITQLEKIYKSIANAKMNVVSIFKDFTKAEISAIISNERVLDKTWSCFKIQGQSKMCGLCYACIVRRLSLMAVGYKEPAETYEVDAFKIERSKLTGVALQDLDILRDTFMFFEQILHDKSALGADLFDVPDNFFSDADTMMKNFALDMFLGMKKAISEIDDVGTLGRFCRKVSENI